MGCTLIIRSLQQSFVSDEIESFYDILNGTTNYILTRMKNGLSYKYGLAEAQEKGFGDSHFD